MTPDRNLHSSVKKIQMRPENHTIYPGSTEAASPTQYYQTQPAEDQQSSFIYPPPISQPLSFHPINIDNNQSKLEDQPVNTSAFVLTGEDKARDLKLERHGGRIVWFFMIAFSLILILFLMAGQYPGQSFSIKIAYDIIPIIGDIIALYFCLRMTLRVRKTARHIYQQQMSTLTKLSSHNDRSAIRNELRLLKQRVQAWQLLTIGVALYGLGQTMWACTDIPIADPSKIPFPAPYLIPFIATYPFFLAGMLLLFGWIKEEESGHLRLLLDAFSIVGATLAISWFFIIQPSISHLFGNPLAKVFMIYLPTGDLFLVAVGAFGLLSTAVKKEQEGVFSYLFWGLVLLAFTDSLLAYEFLNNNYTTALLRIVLDPLSVLCIGLAAIKYPQAIARMQEKLSTSGPKATENTNKSPSSRFQSTFRSIGPFVLAICTAIILITGVASRGGIVLIEATLSAVLLLILVVARQAVTTTENVRLTQQLHQDLARSKSELHAKTQEMTKVARELQEKHALEEAITSLRNVHAQVANGDFSVHAAITAGPLLPIAVSFNLMVDRLGSLNQQVLAYQQLRAEFQTMHTAVDWFARGKSLWEDQGFQKVTEFRPIMLRLMHIQRSLQQQWTTQMQMMAELKQQLLKAREELSKLEKQRTLSLVEQQKYDQSIAIIRDLEQKISQIQEYLNNRDIRSSIPTSR